MRFSVAYASMQNIPSTDMRKVEKWRRCQRQASGGTSTETCSSDIGHQYSQNECRE